MVCIWSSVKTVIVIVSIVISPIESELGFNYRDSPRPSQLHFFKHAATLEILKENNNRLKKSSQENRIFPSGIS